MKVLDLILRRAPAVVVAAQAPEELGDRANQYGRERAVAILAAMAFMRPEDREGYLALQLASAYLGGSVDGLGVARKVLNP